MIKWVVFLLLFALPAAAQVVLPALLQGPAGTPPPPVCLINFNFDWSASTNCDGITAVIR